MRGGTFVYREGLGVIAKRDAPPLVTIFGRAPGIIRDGMDAIKHPCTGQLMDSKAAFRAVTRAHGCEEIGSESPVIRADLFAEQRESDERKRDIHAAMTATEHTPAASAEAVFGAMGASVPVVDGWA